jgi:hypothetical protein
MQAWRKAAEVLPPSMLPGLFRAVQLKTLAKAIAQADHDTGNDTPAD